MSDFLTRLAERTLGLGSVIEPVLPSMFAPVTGLEPFEVGEDVVTGDPADPRRARLDVRADASDPAGAARTAAAPADRRATDQRSAPTNQPPGAQRAADPSIGRPAADLVPSPEARDLPDQARAPLDATAVTRPSERAGIAPLEPVATNAARDVEADAPRAEVPLPRVTSALAALQPLVVAARTPEADPGVALGPRAARAEPSGPTVRITIGRVEVRAVTRPQPAARPRREPTEEEHGLSLSDYLKRGGGGR